MGVLPRSAARWVLRRPGARTPRVPDRPPDALRGRRQLDVFDSQLGERVDDRVNDEHLVTATTMYREIDMPYWLEAAEALRHAK